MAPVGELVLPAARHLPRAGHSPHDGHPPDTDLGDRRRARLIPAPARPAPPSITWPTGCPRHSGGIATQTSDQFVLAKPLAVEGDPDDYHRCVDVKHRPQSDAVRSRVS